MELVLKFTTQEALEMEKNKLFAKVYPMIRSESRSYQRRHPLLNLEDLMQNASMKVWEKLDNFDDDVAQITTFIHPIILDAHQDELAKTSPLTMGVTNVRIKGRIESGKSHPKISEKRKFALTNMSFISFDSECNGGNEKETTLKDIVPDKENIKTMLIRVLKDIVKDIELDNLLQYCGFIPKKPSYNRYYMTVAVKKIQNQDDETKQFIYDLLSKNQ